MHFPPELWKNIRAYLFHDIRLGRHLRDCPFNDVVASLPRVTPGFDYIAWRSYNVRYGWWTSAHFTSSLLGYCVEIKL